jgi:aminomethyltransferase
MNSAPLRRSPIHEFHQSSGAKLANFGGWEMPIEYPQESGGGVLNEHAAVRERVGLFDVSHLGKASAQGDGALEFLNSCITNDLAKIGDGQAQYNLLCDDATGGVIDDLIIYRRSAEDFFLIPNAANTEEVVRRLEQVAPQGITVTNLHNSYAVFALQGPLAKNVLEDLNVHLTLEYMSFAETEIVGKKVIICRTGYTGELGFEIIPNWEDALSIWNALFSSVRKIDGLVAGLGARDTLRTEMGYPLHGHELSLQITPVQASANWAVAWRKDKFWGKAKLLQEREVGPKRALRGLKLSERGIPRAEMRVSKDESGVGVTTSGTFSPTLKSGIALALIEPEIELGEELLIDIRGKQIKATVVKLPFVPSRVR